LPNLGYENNIAYCWSTVGLKLKPSSSSFICIGFCRFLYVKLLVVLQFSKLQLQNNIAALWCWKLFPRSLSSSHKRDSIMIFRSYIWFLQIL